MPRGYFHRVTAETPTRFWVNNPSAAELEQAIAAGAIACTTNPSYCSKLLQSEPEYIHPLIDRVAAEVRDDSVAADLIYQTAAGRLIQRLRPLYDASGSKQGFVTIQADPREDEDPELIIAAALRYRQLGPNYMAKIPVTEAGLAAIEAMVEHNIPICATEVFAISQAVRVCERYAQAAARTGNHPPFFVTHITGIFDQHLGQVVSRNGYHIRPEVLAQAGCAVGRKEYWLLKEREYEGTMLGGGARGTHHFTEFVGGDVHITINWSTAAELIERDEPVVSRIATETPPEVVAELAEKLPDFRRAYADDGMPESEFADFGPVQLFRNMFLDGYGQLLAQIAARR